MKMHHWLIIVLIILSLGVFLVAKLSIWWIALMIVCCVAIPIVTKDKNLLKFLLPFAIILTVITFIVKIPDIPTKKELISELQESESQLKRYTNIVIEKEKELEISKKEQGLIKSVFKDSEKVNRIEEELSKAKKEKNRLEDKVIDLRREISEK